MKTVLLLQLPIPQLTCGRQTGNVPLAAACLKQAAAGTADARIDILPESLATYLGDAALADLIISRRADVVGFSVYGWNLHRSLYLAERLKKAYGPKVVFGGPEVTPDNENVISPHVDFYVHGEGEAVFLRLLEDKEYWAAGSGSEPADHIFRSSNSPYLLECLEPEIENMVLVETQRGCPYRCGYCYYPKSRDRITCKDEEHVFEAVRWSIERGLGELYLLDPSLNSRPGLREFLGKLKAINHGGRISLISEIRAEAIDESLADLLADAGFAWFEIGLQSTNPEALQVMNRPLNVEKFLRGVRLLKEREILPRIDLIAGLPGDDLEGFMRSVDFVLENGLDDDVQVFPLSVLPGTDFRRRAAELGLDYEPHPPYVINSTREFSNSQIVLAFDYAEYRLEESLHPLPDLDIAWRRDDTGTTGKGKRDLWVELGGKRYLAKLFLDAPRPEAELEILAGLVTHPFQVFVDSFLRDHDFLRRGLEILTARNPHVPLELVFLEPATPPATDRLMEAVRLRRPHFLDVEQRYLGEKPGNRAVLVTVVTTERQTIHTSDMQRQVFWWREERLPSTADLEALDHLDGLLIDSMAGREALHDWQDAMADESGDWLPVCFAEHDMQRRWLELTKPDDYYFGVRP